MRTETQFHPTQDEYARLWRVPDFGDMELLHATFVKHSFSKHVHEGYALGVIVRGMEGYFYQRADHVATAGDVVVINPGEVHTGYAVRPEGWTYRMFYPGVTLMRQIAHEVTGQAWDVPLFNQTVIRDAAIGQRLAALHVALSQPGNTLAQETLLREAIGELIARYARQDSRFPRHIATLMDVTASDQRHAVQQAQTYINQHYADNITLEALASQVGFSPYHFARLFRQQTGIPPYLYLTHVRIERARALLVAGHSILETALDVGFSDQSHLTRCFKRIVGVPPGAYRELAQ